MKDKAFINEFRKRVSELERRYEALDRDLNAARIVLAMLERDSINSSQSAGNSSHTDIVADSIFDLLSLHREMHRSDILKDLLSRGIHVGYDDDQQKLLSGLSTLLSKDSRFTPVKGKNGIWTLTRFLNPESPDLMDDSINTSITSVKDKDGGVVTLHIGGSHPGTLSRYKEEDVPKPTRITAKPL